MGKVCKQAFRRFNKMGFCRKNKKPTCKREKDKSVLNFSGPD